jgi:TPR repeat protein
MDAPAEARLPGVVDLPMEIPMRACLLALLLLPGLATVATAAEPKPAAKLTLARWDLDAQEVSCTSGRQLLTKIGFVARFDEAEKAAKAGDAMAATLLAIAYQTGTGIEADLQRARYWAERAAKAGNPRGMNTLGTLLAQQDQHDTAFDWFRRAAEAGNAIGMSNLGNAYAQGRGTVQDMDQALRWYRRAGDAGAPVGMLHLAHLYLNGTGIPRDDATAASWVRKAAELGEDEGDRLLGELYLAGRGVPADAASGRAWLKRAADKGNNHARTRLATLDVAQREQAAAAEAQRQAQLAAQADDDDDDDLLGVLGGVALGVMAGSGDATAQMMSNVIASASPNASTALQMGAALGAAGAGKDPLAMLATGDLGPAPGGFAVPNYGASKAAPAKPAAAGNYAPRPNTLLGSAACRGYTNENFQQYFAQHSNGPDVQLHSLCAGAFNYYAMYLNAIRQGYSQADSDRTYKAFTDAALVATNFYQTAR